MNNKVFLAIGSVLILVGVLRPDLSNLLPNNNTPKVVVPETVFTEPSNPELLSQADEVATILKNGGEDRKIDGMKLASLYSDIAKLISLDADNAVIKTTSEIREVNSVAGSLVASELKGKYPNLALTARGLVVGAIGDDVTTLNEENRQKAAEAFEALAWGCYMGAK